MLAKSVPERRVRFARANTYHSPPGLTHSLESSPVSSAGLLTPPSHTTMLPGPTPYSLHPHSKAPLKPDSQIRLHPLLSFSTSPLSRYDLMDAPSMMTSHHVRISSRELAEPATSPPVQSMTIVSPHLLWKIRVAPRSTSKRFITVADVLNAIYENLRTNITGAEFAALPTEKDMARATSAYKQRYRRQRDSRAYEEEKKKGMKRVDFLMGFTRFMGISYAGLGSNYWMLNVGDQRL
ncbi:hypothetical protein AMATHDRAFT_5224 [Amanita thiersii Skay4041]|uniref:DUF6699 domain-containing protein n=1 Tax=Amanita thiersii Skay4041 TaxID=703135 RepID=A0A2A9NG73_9AGAR|nr:hypothetical protein AMATHDRAFT_5224 [Amanita thiersii Skay4041]